MNVKQLRKQAAFVTLTADVVKLLMADVRLEDSGYGVGLRLLEVLSYRERNSRREVRLLEMLKFIHTSLWKCLFGRQARELEQSNTVSLHADMHRFRACPAALRNQSKVTCMSVTSLALCMMQRKCVQAEDEYMISDFDLFVTKYISVPKDMGQLNCAAFIAGIVKGALDGAGFPAR